MALTFHASYAAKSLGAVAVQEGNIVYAPPSGVPEVLTETGADAMPALSPDGKVIAFTRLTRVENGQDGEPPVRDLWVMNVDTHKTTKLVTGKPDGDAAKPEQELAGIDQPTFAPDGATVYFMTDAWATSRAIHAVPTVGGRERFVTDGNSLDVVKRGRYKNALLVQQHRYINGHGSWNPAVLVSPSGKKIKVVGERRDALQNVEAEQ